MANKGIKLSFLRELQQLFHKDAGELIELYVNNSKKKIAMLYKAVEEDNLSNFKAAAQELRHRSLDIGAIQFSYNCLALEMAAQEMCIERLPRLISLVESQFGQMYKELEMIKGLSHRVPV